MSSKFLEDNKQALHVAAEVIALLGVSVYFSRKNTVLSNQINELQNRLEEQQEIIKRHEHALIQHTRLLQELQDERQPVRAPKARPKPPRVVPPEEEEDEVRIYHTSKPVAVSPPARSPKPIPKSVASAPAPASAKTMLEDDDVGDVENESELDAELESELNELNLETEDKD